jgi:site-specific DNA recombinase
LNGRARSYDEIANREGVTKRYIGHLLPLAFLAPDIVAAILTGDQPIDLTAETLTKRTDLLLSWPAQKAALRLPESSRASSK